MAMKMEEGLDTGPIGMAERVAIGPDMTAGELHDKLAPLGADLMLRALGAVERGALDADAAAGGRRHLREQDRQGRDPHRLAQVLERGSRPYPRAVAVSRRVVRVEGRERPGAREGAAHDKGRGQGRARHACSTTTHHRLRRRRGPDSRVAARRQAADEGGRIPARHAVARRRHASADDHAALPKS